MLLNYIVLLLIVIMFYVLFVRYNSHNSIDPDDNYSLIKQYLITDSTLAKSKKPIMWIYVPYHHNSRKWKDFGSRNSLELNQPYLYLTVQSIIKENEDSFHICVIDNYTFNKLIPNWDIDISKISEPISCYMVQLAMIKLLYYYGGIIVPISFLCFKNLINLYIEGTANNKMFICENINKGKNVHETPFSADTTFMGALKNNDIVHELMKFIEVQISTNITSELMFKEVFNNWCNTQIQQSNIKLIDGKLIGIKDKNNVSVLINNLLGESIIPFCKKTYGIYIPADDILKRNKYEWFANLTTKEILEGNTILQKYILLALSPDSKFGVIAPDTTHPDWISFWKVPSNVNLYGPKPLGLGYVLKANN